MKSHTDLKQSRTLSEFLSHTTADQTWERIAVAGANLDVPEELQYRHNGDMPFILYSGIGIPCWSLVALFDVLPSATLDSSDNHCYRLHCMKRFTEWNDNAVDAAFEMVCRLKAEKYI